MLTWIFTGCSDTFECLYKCRLNIPLQRWLSSFCKSPLCYEPSLFMKFVLVIQHLVTAQKQTFSCDGARTRNQQLYLFFFYQMKLFCTNFQQFVTMLHLQSAKLTKNKRKKKNNIWHLNNYFDCIIKWYHNRCTDRSAWHCTVSSVYADLSMVKPIALRTSQRFESNRVNKGSRRLRLWSSALPSLDQYELCQLELSTLFC